MKTILKNSFFIYYPISVTISIYLLNQGVSNVVVLLTLLACTISFNLFTENVIPFNKTNYKKPYSRDFGMVLLNVFLTARLGDFLVQLVLIMLSQYLFSTGLINVSILGPFCLQVIVAFLLVELVRYATHYTQHKIPFLWKLHAVHHSVPEIYSLNNYYTHPIDYILRNILSFPVLALVGFNYEVISVVAVLSTVGMFAHSGADYNLGFISYIFSTNRLHRWHHSALPSEADKNFGASLIIWDQVFNTFYLPKDRIAPEQSGLLENHPYTPSGFIEIVFYPFIKK